MKLQLATAILSALPLAFAGTYPVNSLWDLRTTIVGTADDGDLAMICSSGGSSDCMIAALENCFVAAGNAMKDGARGGSQQGSAKRDVNDLVSFAEKPAEFNGKVFTKFPDNVWRADVTHDHLNETVMEQASELGTTFVRKENDVVYVSSSNPEENDNTKRDANANDNPQKFSNVVVAWRANAPTIKGIAKPDANAMASGIVQEVNNQPRTLCATLADKNNGGGSVADFGITVNSDQWSFVKNEPACAAN